MSHDNDEPKRTFRDEYYSIGVEDTGSVIERLSARVGASYDWQKALEAQDYDSDTGIISDQETTVQYVAPPTVRCRQPSLR